MDVVVVWCVVDGLEETLELTRGSAVDDQHEGDPYRHELGSLWGVLFPLYVHISLTWTEQRGAHNTYSILNIFKLLLLSRPAGNTALVSTQVVKVIAHICFCTRDETIYWLVDKQEIKRQPLKNLITVDNILLFQHLKCENLLLIFILYDWKCNILVVVCFLHLSAGLCVFPTILIVDLALIRLYLNPSLHVHWYFWKLRVLARFQK